MLVEGLHEGAALILLDELKKTPEYCKIMAGCIDKYGSIFK
jgi:hypothetical protein